MWRNVFSHSQFLMCTQNFLHVFSFNSDTLELFSTKFENYRLFDCFIAYTCTYNEQINSGSKHYIPSCFAFLHSYLCSLIQTFVWILHRQIIHINSILNENSSPQNINRSPQSNYQAEIL